MNEEQEMLLMGRRPKRDPLDDYETPQDGGEEEFDEDEDENEEVDFENNRFDRSQIWDDYAEDLDYDD